jgi:membrane fusion protein (multidrug efflux system)
MRTCGGRFKHAWIAPRLVFNLDDDEALGAEMKELIMSEAETIERPSSLLKRLSRWVVPALILLFATAIVLLIAGNWNVWANEKSLQETDDAYTRADLTPLSTKVAALVAKVAVSDYQSVKAGDLLVQLRDDDFRAQVRQAEAGVAAGEDALVNNRRQKELQDVRIAQAEQNIGVAEAQVKAADAGIEAANASIANAQGSIEGTKPDVERSQLERSRQEALVATESATRQKLEQVVADQRRYVAILASREADLAAAAAQLASRQADLARARAQLGSAKAEFEAQKRLKAVQESQELLLQADLNSRRAALSLAETNLGYTRIIAPEDGIVSERRVRAGQLVSPGTQVLTLVQRNVWVQANYKETQVGRLLAGDDAEIKVDALPGVVFHGNVDQVAPASGSQFALLPPDNATGNFTKVVQRVPVKILLKSGQADLGRLRPGLSVTASIRTSPR